MTYTLVQHSGFGYARNPQFKRAVEERYLSDKQAEKVKELGGLLFENYGLAHDAAEAENYPPSVQGLIPCVAGSFHKLEIDGLRLYLPK